MIAELGLAALWLAAALAALQLLAGALSLTPGGGALAGIIRPAAVIQGALVALAFLALLLVFAETDLSVRLVAMNSHSAKPLIFKIAGAWGNHEGSMLLWVTIMGLAGGFVALVERRLPERTMIATLAGQAFVSLGFYAFLLLASNPFARLDPAPTEGQGLNPLLQDLGLAFHPPTLYVGYVGLSIAFSFAIGALVTREVGPAFARAMRPWVLGAWIFLTLGITAGSYWAYYELGWGGWWFWDPVENASLMPWLAATALLHSVGVLAARDALRAWTIMLGVVAFSMSMVGTFLVRSGILTSVHAFAVDPTRGILLLSIMGIAAGAGFVLFALRAPSLNSGGLFAPVSRESAIVLNNIILSTATAVVLVGTLFPLIREAMDGEAVSVGAPFFNMTFVPLMVLAMAVLPAGPLLAWKRGDARLVVRRLWLALALAAILGLVAFAVVAPRSALASAGLVVGFWLIGGAALELAERIKAFRAPWAEVRRRAVGLPRGAWGTTLAHAGLGVFVLGASFETTWRVEAAQALSLGGRLKLGAYELALTDVGTVEGSNYVAERGIVKITKAGAPVCEARPERRFYPTGKQTTSEVAICPKVLDDLYVVLGERRAGDNGQPAWLVRAFVNPWVRLIFLGPLVMAIGGLVSLSDRRLRFGVARKVEKAA